MRVAYVLPTRNRPERVAQTLDALAALGPHDAQVIVVDNASEQRPIIPKVLSSGLPVTLLARDRNEGAAARNAGADASDRSCDWIVMLDDDSHPRDLGHLAALGEAPADVLAVSADIHLPAHGRRESGGLPEVFIGCGVAIRRAAFCYSGGYDPSFGYYAEEYDLAARLIMAQGRVLFDPRFVVDHHKVEAGRNMDLILSRLVRNNGWIAQRYAPTEPIRRAEQRETIRRYRGIAEKESALAGYAEGLVELRRTRHRQARTPMPMPMWRRFTGFAHAVRALDRAHAARRFSTAAIVDEGKNAWVVRHALEGLGVRIVGADAAEALVIGTMSPGPMLDALERRRSLNRRVVAPWLEASVALTPSVAA